MKTHTQLSFLIIVVIVFHACLPVNVITSKFDPDAKSRNYQTYNFYDVEVSSPESSNLNPENIEVLKEAISRELEAVGLTKSDDPDIWVNIGITVEEKQQTRETDIRDAPLYIGQRNYSWQSEEIVVEEYKEGTVKIDLIDTKSNKMVGQAIATSVLVKNKEKMKERINEGIAKVFDELWSSGE